MPEQCKLWCPGQDHLAHGSSPTTLSPLTLTGIWGAPPLCEEPQQMLHLPSLTLIRKLMSFVNTLSPGLLPSGPSIKSMASLVGFLGHPDPVSQNLHPGYPTCPQGLSLSSLVLSVAFTPTSLGCSISVGLVSKSASPPTEGSFLSLHLQAPARCLRQHTSCHQPRPRSHTHSPLFQADGSSHMSQGSWGCTEPDGFLRD